MPSTLRILRIVLIGLFALLTFGSAVSAQTQVSSLADSVTGSLGVGETQWVGLAFTTDAQTYALGSVTAPVFVNTAGTLEAQLYAGTGGGDATGSALASFGFGAITGTPANVTFTPVSGVTLNANTQYVFVLSASDLSAWGWSAAPSGSSFTTPAGNPWTMSTQATLSGDSGASWSQAAPFMPLMSVSATPVPESAAFASTLGVVALAGVVLVRRRRV